MLLTVCIVLAETLFANGIEANTRIKEVSANKNLNIFFPKTSLIFTFFTHIIYTTINYFDLHVNIF